MRSVHLTAFFLPNSSSTTDIALSEKQQLQNLTYDVCCVIIYVYSGEKREFNAGQFFADLFTVGLEAVAFGGAAKGLRNAETASWCFVAGTLVATEDGQMPYNESIE